MPMLDMVVSTSNLELEDDYRGYGGTGGIIPLKNIFSEILDVPNNQIYIGSTMSTTIMYDVVCKAMFWGLDGEKPWKDLEKVKFICPSPGYEKHFKICETFGIEMIPVDINDDGPDMVEELVSKDENIKGIWCVPLYSNPTGAIYSDSVVERIARMKAAQDFRIFWDNAYVVHHLTEEIITVKNIITECEKAGNPNRVFEFFSTSKITFPGGGVAGCASSKENIKWLQKKSLLQLKTGDKINQYRHALFLKDKKGVLEHMNRHKQIIKPKFDLIDQMLESSFGKSEVVKWNNPKGGYFINLKLQEGKAMDTYKYCREHGVGITPAGSTFPHGNDPKDQYLRLAPTYPSKEELEMAMSVLCEAIKKTSDVKG
jgi:DNA-binding transcriptional MocR family regulator